jgi:hypothetical protein
MTFNGQRHAERQADSKHQKHHRGNQKLLHSENPSFNLFQIEERFMLSFWRELKTENDKKNIPLFSEMASLCRRRPML